MRIIAFALITAAASIASVAHSQTGQSAATPSAGQGGVTVTAPEPVPTQRPPSAIAPERAYRINPGDQIEIYVWGDERLQRVLTVLPDGSFAFPLVGTIRAEGRSTTELEAEIGTRLASQYRGTAPQVTVSVKVPSGLQIAVIGKVRAPGSFSPGRYVTLVEALALAGGPTEFADINNVVVIRNRGGQTSVVSGQLSSLLRGKPSERDLQPGGIPVLQPGDTVIVP